MHINIKAYTISGGIKLLRCTAGNKKNNSHRNHAMVLFGMPFYATYVVTVVGQSLFLQQLWRLLFAAK